MRRARSADQFALLGAVVLLAGSGGWFGWMQQRISHGVARWPKIESVDPCGEGRAAFKMKSASGIVEWVDPAEEAGEQDWVFDVFTPPVIFYNRETGRFSVTRPELDDTRAVEAAGKPFGMELIGVEPELYRLQIVGYAGRADDAWGIFENQVTGEAILGQAGVRFEDLDLAVKTLVVRREDLIMPDSMPLREIVGVAEVWDAIDQRLVRLASNRKHWTDTPIAIVRNPLTGEEQRVKAGDQIKWADDRFEIGRVSLEPASVMVGKLTPNEVREMQTLRPGTDLNSHIETETFTATP